MNTTSTPPANATWKKITAVCLSALLLLFVSLQTIAQVIPAVHCNSTAATATFSQATPTAIPTGPAVVTSNLVVSGASTYLFDLNLTTFITHTFASDLDITLTSPSGTVVTLSTDNGAGNDNVFNGTIWDDDANPAGSLPYTTNNGLVTDHVYANLTLASPLVPEEALGAFIGENPNGTWTITISDDLSGDGGSLDSWSMEVTGLAVAPSTFFDVFSDSPALAIADVGVVSSTITVSGIDPYILDLNVVTNITHTFTADLDVTITSPAGTVVTLTSDNGAGNDDIFAGTTWNDDADPDGLVPYTTNNGLVTDQVYVNLTVATPLVPEDALSAFIGEDPNGVWTITISDDLSGDVGTLNSWGLDFATVGDVVPPSISCGGDITADNATGTCASAFIDLTGTATSSDACSTPVVTYSPSSGNFSVGTTTVTATATDGAGNTNTCTFDVIISDTENPALTCPSDIVQSNDGGLCSAVVNYTTPVGVDNCEPVLTQSLDQTILGGSSVSCNAGGLHTNNSYMRVFDLPALGYTNDFYINSVDVGIEQALGNGGSQPATVNFYSLSGSLLFANLTLLGSEAVTVADQTLSVLNIPLTNQLTVPAGTVLVVEFFTPDGQGAGHSLFIGSNNLGQTGDTYIAAADCGIPQPLATAAIGFPNMHWVLNINAGTLTEQTAGLASGSTFAVGGPYTQTFQATDVYGNTSTCSFDVTVEDTENPTIDCNIIGGGGNSTVASANVPVSIPDNPAVTSTLTFPSSGVITDVNVLNLEGTHTWIADLEISLTSPQGTVVTLMNNPCGSSDNFDVNFDDAGAAHGTIACTTPYGANSTYQAFQALAAFNGENSNGVWTLTIDDQAAGDIGTLTAWSLQIATSGSNTVTASNDAGVCEAAVTVPAPTFGDNCSGSTIENDFNNTADASDTYPVGTTTVTWTATDVAGNTNTCTMDVVVEDTEDPTVTCPGDIAIDNNPGDCGAVVTFAATSTDNCPGETISFSPASGSFFAVGTTVVTATATDAAGNTASCTFNVTVSDTEEPSLVCPSDILQSNDAGLCSANVTYTAPVGVDNCEPVLTQSLDQTILGGSSVSCNAGGLHTNNSYMRVFDLPALGYTNDFYINSVDVGIELALGAGGSQPATVNFYSLAGPLLFANLTSIGTEAVTVADQTLSVLNIPLTNQLTVPAGTVLVVEFFTPDGQGAGHSLFVGSNNLGQTGDTYLAAADCGITEPTSVADIGFPNMHWVLNINSGTLTEQTAGLGSGADFPVGTTTESYQATDVYGNVANCSFDVVVNDVEVPTINCGADPIVCDIYASTNVPVTLADVTISTSTLTVSGAGPTINDLNVLGLQGVHTWVGDLTVELTSPGGTTVQLWSALCGSADDFNISLDDEAGTGIACPINLGNTEMPVNPLSAFDGENPNGTWTISFTDGAGGDVGQLDAWSLEICTGTGGTTVYAQSNDAGDCGAVVTIAAPSSSDNCPLTLTNDYNGTSDATDFYPVGTTVVEWTVEDPSGNTASCSVTVIVTDDEFPVVTCPSPVFADNDEGQCGAIVTFADPIATDNCPLPAIAQFSDNSGLSIPDSDPSGTSASQTVSVTGTSLGTDVFLQSVCLDVTHSWVGDLEFVLESPNGDLITLMTNSACAGDNLDVCFVPGTGSPLSGGTCANAPAYSGDFTAEGGDLAALSTGTDPNGTWTLYAYDYVGGDVGTVNNWTLTFLDLGGTPAPLQTAGLPSGSEFPVGTTTNTFEVTDAAGNTSTCSFDVVVSDVEAPAITCPGDIEVDNDAGVCGAVVDYDAPTGFQSILEQLGNSFENGFVSNTTFPNIGADNFVVADGDCYDISNVTANFFVTSPNLASSFDVIFYDDNNGEPGNVINTVNLTSSQWTTSYQGSNFGFDIYEFDFNFPSAVTLCGSTGGTPYWMSVVANGTAAFDYFWEVSTLGDYGSEGVLSDNTGGPWDDSNGIDFVFGLNEGGNTPDNCVGPVTVTQTDGTGYTDGDEFPIGTTLQEYTAEDQYGNISVCSFNVVVNDTEAPVITCSDDIIACDGDVVTFTVTTSDNCPGETLVQTAGLPSGSVFPLGITTNTFEVTDASGNTATCSFDVNVTPVPVADYTYAPSCVGEIIYFTSTATVDPSGGTSIVSHEWEFSDGSGINTDVNPTHVYNTAGDYDVTLVVTTNWGCTDTITYTVTVSDPPVYTIDVVEPTCNGDENGSITINVTGGNSPITFSLNGGSAQSGNVFSGLAAGTYVITLANGCTETVSVTVGEPAAIVLDATSQPVLCNGDASGSIEVTATGGTGVLQYSVDGGNTFQPTGSFSGLAAGTYVVVVEDENGCSVSEGVVITEPSEAVTATAEVQNVSCTGDASGSVVVSANGGTGAYTYSSDGGTTTQSSNVFGELAAGDYTITVTDANGCSTTVDVTVEEPAELLTIETTSTPVSCSGQGDGMIDVTATGGGAPYEYSFNGGITYQSSGSFTNLAPGTYTVVVRDANGCEVASIVVVTQPAALTVSAVSSSPSSCEGDDSGSFIVEAAGGTEPYTYTSNGNSNSTGEFTNVTSGTQLVTVTDASGCSASISVEVGFTSPLPVAAFNWFASGSVVQFSNQSDNGTSYDWNFGDGGTSTDQNPVHTYAAGGTYTVTLIVTNACGSDTITYVIDTNNIGINDPNADASVLNVYPNPNHGQFTLNYTSTGIIGDIQVNVMTIEGKLLMAEQFTVNADTFVRNYSDIELAAGIYIVQFISQTGTEVKRITVDK